MVRVFSMRMVLGMMEIKNPVVDTTGELLKFKL